MGSPSRNVQYHPPRLSEDRLNLPQPHSPSLPTHCSGKSGMRPPGTAAAQARTPDIGNHPFLKTTETPQTRRSMPRKNRVAGRRRPTSRPKTQRGETRTPSQAQNRRRPEQQERYKREAPTGAAGDKVTNDEDGPVGARREDSAALALPGEDGGRPGRPSRPNVRLGLEPRGNRWRGMRRTTRPGTGEPEPAARGDDRRARMERTERNRIVAMLHVRRGAPGSRHLDHRVPGQVQEARTDQDRRRARTLSGETPRRNARRRRKEPTCHADGHHKEQMTTNSPYR